MKRILSVLLVLCMMISLSLTAKAEQLDHADAGNDSVAHTAVSDEDITAVGNNSIGAILATGLNAAQEEDAPTDDISNVVTDVKIRQGCFTGPDEALCDEAIVSFTAQERCRVVVGVYDDDGQEMLLSHKSNILDPGTQSTRLIFGSWYAKNLPTYFYLRVFLLDEQNKPLCDPYETEHYTQAYQEFFNKTTNDFDADKVVNFDNSQSNNFAVLADDVISLNEGGANILSDRDGNRYVFSHIDSTLRNLKPGDKFTFTGTGGSPEAIKAASVTISGDTATVIAEEDVKVDEFFSYVKIGAESALTGQEEPDMSEAGDGVTYAGPVDCDNELAPTGASAGASVGAEHYANSALKFNLGELNDNGGLSGSATLQASVHVNYFHAPGVLETTVTTTNSFKLAVSLKGEVDMRIPLGRIPIPVVAGITISSSVELLIRAEVELEGNATVTSMSGFHYGLMTGYQNLSSEPQCVPDAELKGKLFIGLEISFNIELVAGVVEIRLPIYIGMEFDAELDRPAEGEVHLCETCYTGALFAEFKLDIHMGYSLFGLSGEEKVTLVEYKRKIDDFYYSTDLGFGWGICPNKGYVLSVYVVDKNGNPIFDARVNDEYKTNLQGLAKIAANGNVTINVKAEDYLPQIRTVCVTGAKTLTFVLNKIGQKQKNNLNDIPTDSDIRLIYPSYETVIIAGSGTLTEDDFSGISFSEKTMVLGGGVTAITNLPNNDNLETLVISDSVEYIGAYAFSSCKSLKSITFGDNVTHIGSGAFNGCTNLVEIVFPDSLISIDERAFRGCTSLRSVKFGKGIQAIGDSAFKECTSLKSVKFGSSLQTIGDYAFEDTGLTSVTIPDSVLSIGASAFCGCGHMTSVDVGRSLQNVGEYAFSGSPITSVYIHDVNAWCHIVFSNAESNPLKKTYVSDLNSFNNGADLYLNGQLVTNLILPDTLTKLGDYIFTGCKSLKSVTFPKKLKEIGAGAFWECTALSGIKIPDSVTSIGSGAFSSCTALKSAEIPNSVTRIGSGAFSGCSGLSEIKLPEALTQISDSVFASCTGLKNVIIPISVTEIGNNAFDHCTGLTSILFLGSVTRIGDYAFDGCSALATVPISESLNYLGSFAFRDTPFLESIYQKSPDGIVYYRDIALGVKGSYPSSVIVKNGTRVIAGSFCSVFNREIAEPWFSEGDVDHIDDWVVVFRPDGYVIDEETRLDPINSVIIPDSVVSIGACAFGGCKNLTDVTIGNSVEEIDSGAFAWCAKLSSVTIPDSVTKIGKGAFRDCKGLSNLTLGNSVKEIGERAFANCSGLTSVTIPKSVTSLGYKSFNIFNLTHVTIQAKLSEEMIYDAFSGSIWYSCRASTGAEPVTTTGTSHSAAAAPASIAANSPASASSDDGSLTLTDGMRYTCEGLEPGSMALLVIAAYGSDFATDDYNLTTYYLQQVTVDSDGKAAFNIYGDYTDRFWGLDVYINCSHSRTHPEVTVAPTSDEDGVQIERCDYCGEAVNVTVLEAQPDASCILGDADGDDSVTILDATAIQRYLANLPNAEFNKKAADADEDGSVSILDATAIQRYLANLSTNQNIGKQIV